ncbi:MAG: ABC transporter ATP-binding protein [Chloroflexota bacterium]
MPHAMTHAIEVEGLTRSFASAAAKGAASIRALDGLSFTVEAGEVFGVLGHNGAGKTTLVRVINGILTPTSGSAHVLGLDAATQGSEVRRQTGVLTETPSLYERLTARDNLKLFAALYEVPNPEQRVAEMLSLFNLTDRANDRAGGFSKGMKQRLALARALVHDPQILFLDEPTAALDPEAARTVTTLIETLSRESGRTVFLATHNLDEAQRLCTRVAILSHGKLLALGTTAELGRQLWSALWLDFDLRAALSEAEILHIKQTAGVNSLQTGNTTLAVQVADEARIPAVIAAVAASGAQVMRVNPRQHSLEDIYFELQRRAGESS